MSKKYDCMAQRNPQIDARVKVTPATVGGAREFHVSAAPGAAPLDAAAQARSLYQAVASRLADAPSLRIVAERVFGRLSDKAEVLEARSRVLAESALASDAPVTYLEGSPARGGSPAGVQLVLVSPGHAARVEPLTSDAGPCGCLVAAGTTRRAWLSGMHGIMAGRSPEAQAALMFERTQDALASAGMTWGSVICTRIYVRRLLDWYAEFNGVRNAFYRKLGLIAGGRYDVPASTGIQGKSSDDGECVMDVFAASTGGAGTPAFEKLHNPLQSEATDYGSSFARGARLDLPGARYVFVSGTASIDAQGKSVFQDDPPAQARQTLDSFEAVARAGGAAIAEIVHGTCFCKDAAYAAAFEREVQRRRWPDFPWPLVVADVCRPDLLLEIDGVAVTRL